MYPRKFDYLAPESLDEALEALAGNPGAKVLAGGHSLLPLMKLRLFSPDLLVDIGRIPGLDEIREEDGRVVLGANVTHAQVVKSDLVRTKATALWEAASYVGDVQVRNRGTVCGSLAHADPASDEPAASLALGGEMVAMSAEGERTIPAPQFFVDTMLSALEPHEILTEVRIPTGEGAGSAYDKLGRRGPRNDFAVAGAAALVRLGDGEVTEAALALTGVGSVVSVSEAVGEALRGTDGSPESVERAAEAAAEGVEVVEDLYGSRAYKSHLARVYARRVLTTALERTRGEWPQAG